MSAASPARLQNAAHPPESPTPHQTANALTWSFFKQEKMPLTPQAPNPARQGKAI